MPTTTLKRCALPLTFAAVAAGGALGSGATHAATTTKYTYNGPTEDMRWGTVQVSIVVKNKKITTVKSVVDIHTNRSQFINDNALPLLKQEVLQAQNAKIDTISGATDTSGAYIQSLQSAVKKAHKGKTL